jgi:hypothetical protein
MFCLITFSMMATAVSVAELPCSDFALKEPKQQVGRWPAHAGNQGGAKA